MPAITYFSPVTVSASSTVASSATSIRIISTIDNTSTLYTDVMVQFSITYSSAGTPSGVPVTFYAFGAIHATHTGSLGGTTPDTFGPASVDLARVCPSILTTRQNARIIATIPYVLATNATYVSEPISLASVFGGFIPPYVGLAYINASGGPVDTVGFTSVGVQY